MRSTAGIVIGVVLALTGLGGCGDKGDKCERVYDRLKDLPTVEPLKPEDRDAKIGKCREELKLNPASELGLDCILAIEGNMTMDKLIRCANVGKAPRK